MATFSRDTIYAPLRFPRLYNLLQELVGGGRDRADFVRTYVAFRPDEKVVDAGCGTGSALEFLPAVNYFGFDPNPEVHSCGAVTLWEPRRILVRRCQQPTSSGVGAGRRRVSFAGSAPSSLQPADRRNIAFGTGVFASRRAFHFLRALLQRER